MHRLTSRLSANTRFAAAVAVVVCAALPCAFGCSPSGSKHATLDGAAAAGAGGATDTTSGSGGANGFGGNFGAGGNTFVPVPVRALPGLDSITFYERTGGVAPTDYLFVNGGPELGARLADPLDKDNMDIPGAATEYYDVYYSNEQGDFELDGSYLTISGVFAQTSPWGGGLNLAEIGLNYSDNTVEYGNYVASFVASGDNAIPSSVDACIDGDLETNTTMGNTAAGATRLRITLGFASTSGPPPN